MHNRPVHLILHIPISQYNTLSKPGIAFLKNQMILQWDLELLSTKSVLLEISLMTKLSPLGY